LISRVDGKRNESTPLTDRDPKESVNHRNTTRKRTTMSAVRSTEQKKEFSKKLMHVRMAAKPKISQTDLAKKTGISNSSISNYECGKTMPDAKNLAKLAKVLPALVTGNGVTHKKPSIVQHARVSTPEAQAECIKALLQLRKNGVLSEELTTDVLMKVVGLSVG
jgi:transcriptional regulator with XRE-family HTH domain